MSDSIEAEFEEIARRAANDRNIALVKDDLTTRIAGLMLIQQIAPDLDETHLITEMTATLSTWPPHAVAAYLAVLMFDSAKMATEIREEQN